MTPEADDALHAVGPPPAGGFGRAPAEPGPLGPIPPAARPRDAGRPLVAAAILLGLLACLGAIGVVAVRKYIQGAKLAEPRSTVARIAAHAASAYERSADEVDPPSGVRRLCPSARAPVPAAFEHVAGGRKYQSSRADWIDDPGYACLGYERTEMQYYQYDYTSAGDGFHVTASGDLDGDGLRSYFELGGRVQSGILTVSPRIEETDPDE